MTCYTMSMGCPLEVMRNAWWMSMCCAQRVAQAPQEAFPCTAQQKPNVSMEAHHMQPNIAHQSVCSGCSLLCFCTHVHRQQQAQPIHPRRLLRRGCVPAQVIDAPGVSPTMKLGMGRRNTWSGSLMRINLSLICAFCSHCTNAYGRLSTTYLHGRTDVHGHKDQWIQAAWT